MPMNVAGSAVVSTRFSARAAGRPASPTGGGGGGSGPTRPGPPPDMPDPTWPRALAAALGAAMDSPMKPMDG